MATPAELTVQQAFSSAEVQRMLPQRFPLLMVDRILGWSPASWLRAVRSVTGNDPLLVSHFPDNPVMPGVLLIEGIAQSALLLGYLSFGKSAPPLLGSVKAKFLKPVVPGDQLVYEVTLVKKLGAGSYYQGTARVDGVTVAECDLAVALTFSTTESK